MEKKRGLFLFADYYDATTASRRVLGASKSLFAEIEFLYWARLGEERKTTEEIFKGITFKIFKETAKPRSLGVLILFIKFQIWIFKMLYIKKPRFVVAFTFYTIFPSLIYKYIFNRRCQVIYDPRDYVSVSFRINKLLTFVLNFIDNIFIKLSNFVIFPDRQYFIYYGRFNLKASKYLILPNSTEDLFDKTLNNDIFQKYNLPRNKKLIPILGYFSETRGEKILFSLIEEKHDDLYFVFAGDIRDENHLNFFSDNRDNVIYLGKIPYLDALTIMKESLLVPQLYDPQLLNNVYALPTKYYDCLMVGTPIVVSKGQIDVANEIVENNFGWAINYSDIDSLRIIIFNLIENPNIIKKENLRNFFLNKYDYNLFKPKLEVVYKRILNKAYGIKN